MEDLVLITAQPKQTEFDRSAEKEWGFSEWFAYYQAIGDGKHWSRKMALDAIHSRID